MTTATFRGRQFVIAEGATHPAYSLACFDEAGDEGPFRAEHWHPELGDVVVDVGASYGAYALTAAACRARVLAFEPEPTVRVDLERNVALNPGFDVRVIGEALWSCRTVVDMGQYARHWPAQTISCPYPTTTLDSYELDRCDWAKIDVEGAEVEVLTGALETLRRCRPVVIVEVHTFISSALLPMCRGLLESCGYTRFEEYEREPCVIVIARPGKAAE